MQLITFKQKLIAVIIIFILFPINLLLPLQSAQARRITIVIDPGHGGKDSGAVGHRRLKEKDVNLKVGLRLRKYLLASGVNVVMTRSTDKYISLSKRVAIANKAGADRFISIHHNSCSKAGINGTETYVKRRVGGTAKNLGVMVENALAPSLKLPKRGLKKANFYVITYTKIPAILTEGSFISNPKEEARLRTNKRIDQEARGIYNGLRKHMNLKSLKDALGLTGTSSAAQELYFPNVIDKQGVWHSLISIMNTNSSSRAVIIRMINSAGSVVKEISVNIRPNSRYLLVPRKILKTGFNGSVSVSTNDSSLTGYLSQSRPDGSTMGLSQATPPVTSLSFPRVTDTAKSWRSMITVQNTNEVSNIDVTADFYSNGVLLMSKVFRLKPLQSYDFYPRKILGKDFSGVIKLDSTEKFTSLISKADVKGKTFGLMPGIPPSSQMVFPYVNDTLSFYKSNITIGNVSEETAVFDIQLRDLKGKLKIDKTVNLGPGKNYDFSPRKFNSSDFSGTVTITSQQENGSASLTMRNKENTALGLVEPQVPLRDANYAYVQDNGFWSSFISAINMSENSDIFTMKLFNNSGTLLKTYPKTFGPFTGCDYSPYSFNQNPFAGPVEISGSNTDFTSVLVMTN
jgi:N-acetylmuramoyl-L-alanine amidase